MQAIEAAGGEQKRSVPFRKINTGRLLLRYPIAVPLPLPLPPSGDEDTCGHLRPAGMKTPSGHLRIVILQKSCLKIRFLSGIAQRRFHPQPKFL